jgi:hypothetical protein
MTGFPKLAIASLLILLSGVLVGTPVLAFDPTYRELVFQQATNGSVTIISDTFGSSNYTLTAVDSGITTLDLSGGSLTDESKLIIIGTAGTISSTGGDAEIATYQRSATNVYDLASVDPTCPAIADCPSGPDSFNSWTIRYYDDSQASTGSSSSGNLNQDIFNGFILFTIAMVLPMWYLKKRLL